MADVYDVKELEKGFWCITEGHVRMFLVEGSDYALLVDTGNGGGDIKALAQSLTSKPITLVLTHNHPDHVGGTGNFETAYIHKDEVNAYKFGPFGNKALTLVPIEEGHVFDIGGRKFEVLHLPGHTKGSIGLLDRANKLLLSADTVQEGPMFMLDPVNSSFATLEKTMQRLEAMKDAIQTIYPSHFALPIDTFYFKELEIAAAKMQAGELTGFEAPNSPMKGKIYACGKVKFLSN